MSYKPLIPRFKIIRISGVISDKCLVIIWYKFGWIIGGTKNEKDE
jgi:hypothetical protein